MARTTQSSTAECFWFIRDLNQLSEDEVQEFGMEEYMDQGGSCLLYDDDGKNVYVHSSQINGNDPFFNSMNVEIFYPGWCEW